MGVGRRSCRPDHLARPAALLVSLLALALASPGALAEVRWERALEDLTGHEWSAELVHFRIAVDGAVSPETCRLMLHPEGTAAREIPFQVAVVSGQDAKGLTEVDLYCLVDLPAFGKLTLRLEDTPASPELARPMDVARDGDVLRIDSGALTIEVPGRAEPNTPESRIPAPLLRMGSRVLVATGLQMGGVAVLAAGVAYSALDVSPFIAALIGLAVSLSSTAISLKQLSDRGELTTAMGSVTTGISALVML